MNDKESGLHAISGLTLGAIEITIVLHYCSTYSNTENNTLYLKHILTQSIINFTEIIQCVQKTAGAVQCIYLLQKLFFYMCQIIEYQN